MFANRNGSTSVKMSSIVLTLCLCLMTLYSDAYPLSRSQRQTVTNELASGLTNTGVGFQSWGKGQSSYLPQDDLYGGYNGLTGVDGSYGYGAEGSYGYDYGGKNYEGQGWRGFGNGKNPHGAARPPHSQYGIKY